MYKVEIQTTKGNIDIEINDIKDLQKIIEHYKDIYLGCHITFCEGNTKNPLINIQKQEKKYNTKVQITYFNVD